MGRKRKRKRRDSDRNRSSSKPLTPEVRDRLRQWAEEAAEAHGFQLWDVEITQHGKWIVRVFIDYPDAQPGRGINVDECAGVSRYLEALMDADERVPEAYVLEVSSPGIERPLKSLRHVDQVVGEDVELVVREPVAGKNKVAGPLIGVDDGELIIEVDGEQFEVNWDDVARAKLKFDFSKASEQQ